MGSTCNLSVRLCGCGHGCLKFLKFRAEHCTKWQPHQRDWACIKGHFMTLPFKRTVWRVQSTHTGCGWKVQRKTNSETVRQWDGGRESEGGGEVRTKHKREREENPQKLFDIFHQRATLTCRTLHFHLDAKSPTWGCHSPPTRRTSIPAVVFDQPHQFARAFLGHTPSSHMPGISSEDRKCHFVIYSEVLMFG